MSADTVPPTADGLGTDDGPVSPEGRGIPADLPDLGVDPFSTDDTERPGSMELLRAGVAATPELRAGLSTAIALSVANAAWRLVVPVALQQVLDRGINSSGGVDISFVLWACAVALVVVVVLTVVVQRLTLAMAKVAEDVLYALRTRAFAHVHRLSIAAHGEAKTGVLVSRVTSDIETLSQFATWGAVNWTVSSGVLVVSLVTMFVYSWQLGILTLLVLGPIVPIMVFVQRRQLVAYDNLRNRVGDTLGRIAETVSGVRVIRAYHHSESARGDLHGAIGDQLAAQLKARFFFSIMFPMSDLFGGLLLAVVAGAGLYFAGPWGLSAGVIVACLLLANQLAQPIAEIGEVLDQTQTALAGWGKVLGLLAEPVDVIEPTSGVALASGALPVDVDEVTFSYEPGQPVLHGVSLAIPAGATVAIVGETGSGKTTLSKLLCRLADPHAGSVRIGGVDLRDVAPASRHRAIRLVPQDGFLFDDTVANNVALGRPGADRADVEASFASLGLSDWVEGLPDGLDTAVGERGGGLSVGERQLVALARAQLADPGLLLLDEATSNVDPDTERRLSGALEALSEGRTTISVAHRLSTAEAAELVVVFDAGRIVELGPHDELVAEGGVYARLHQSWVGNTRQ
ncbi:MAG: ABC transporter ATP-binding protein [Microthrixaceae bacterium]